MFATRWHRTTNGGARTQTMWYEFLDTFGTDRKGGGMSGIAERFFVLTFEL